MEQMQNNTVNKDKVCVHEGHCCNCDGCGSMCRRGGMRGYYGRHFLVLIIGVVLAFFVGMKLGEMKGWMMASSGMPMRTHHGWMMDDRANMMPESPAPIAAPVQ